MEIGKIQRLFKGIRKRTDIHLFLRIWKMENVCEVGVWKGKFFRELAKGRPKHLVGIDWWKTNDDPANMANYGTQKEIDKYADSVITWAQLNTTEKMKISVYREDQNIVREQFPDEYFDLVYLDDNHKYLPTKKAIQNWWPKVRHGGILGGHDYYRGISMNGIVYGVVEAADEFVEEQGIPHNLHITIEELPSFFILKP